jgi:transposase
LSGFFRELLDEMAERLKLLDQRIRRYDFKVERIFNQDERCRRLARVQGVGALVATALVAAVGNAHEFKHGRELSAWLGLVPRQHSSGGRNVFLGISKRGDRYLRTLLIHGSRSAVRVVERRRDLRSIAISRLKARRGPNVAAVALANHNARCCGRCSREEKSTARAPFKARPSLKAAERGRGKQLDDLPTQGCVSWMFAPERKLS